MRKKILSILLAFSLAASFTGCGSKEQSPASETSEAADVTESSASGDGQDAADSGEEEGPAQAEMPYSGVTFVYPDAINNAKAVFLPSGGSELSDIKGVYYTVLYYGAVDAEKYMELYYKEELTDEENKFLQDRIVPILEIFGINGGRSLKDLTDLLSGWGYDGKEFKELGSVGEYNFFYIVNPEADRVENELVFDEGFREEFDNVVLPAFDDMSWVKISEPKPPTTVSAGAAVSFETTDLDGNTVKSEDIFSKNKITMVNIWGTYCGPCINEMPDLEVFSKTIAGKQCGFIGIVRDVEGLSDTEHIEAAKEIISDTGVTYLNLVPWDNLSDVLPTDFIPTTYFIDSNGNVVGEAVVGSHTAEQYEALLDEVLSSME